MEKYIIQNGGLFFEIFISFNKDSKNILIQGKININDNIYSLNLKLKDLHSDYEYFQRCNSIKEAFQLFSICFQERRVFINEIYNSGIILGIHTEKNENIFFTLKSYPLSGFNPNYGSPININNDQLYIGGVPSNQNNNFYNERNNPMLQRMVNIQLPK